jgi:hypothetical protein
VVPTGSQQRRGRHRDAERARKSCVSVLSNAVSCLRNGLRKSRRRCTGVLWRTRYRDTVLNGSCDNVHKCDAVVSACNGAYVSMTPLRYTATACQSRKRQCMIVQRR